jgi:polar amino acid transport system permease protein
MAFDWGYFLSLFSLPSLWKACATVVQLSVPAWLIALPLGFLLAAAKQSSLAWVRLPALGYVFFFRSLPFLILLLLVYNLPLLFPGGRALFSTPFIAGLVALVLGQSAYMADVHGQALAEVGKVQQEAAAAIGLKPMATLRLVLVPQALQRVLPALGERFLAIIKLISLVSLISLAEPLWIGQRLYGDNSRVLETLSAVGLYYVAMVGLFGWLLGRLELRKQFAVHEAPLLDNEQLRTLRRGLPALHIRAAVNAAGSPDALWLTHIHKSYGNHPVLDGVDLRVRPGESIALLGPAGSGRSSLIRTINGLERIDQGEIVLFGESYIHAGDRIGSAQFDRGLRRIGMLFADIGLFPHLSVLDNLLLVPRRQRRDEDHALRRQAYAMLDRFGLLAHAGRYPQQLDHAQQQQAALARALLLKPDILLCDDPTAQLEDPLAARTLLDTLRALTEQRLSLMIVTEDSDFALTCDRVVLMEKGRIRLDAAAQTLCDSTDPLVRKALGLD